MSSTENRQVKITIFDSGPIEIVGPFTLVDEMGGTIEFVSTEPVCLCRCGQSGDKPFCDGTHDACGFQSKLSK